MKTKHAILFVAFVTVSVTSFFGLGRSSDYRKVQQDHQQQQESLRREKVRHEQFLNRIFSSIQSNQGRVTFHLKEGVASFYLPPPELNGWVSGYRSFSQGGKFQDLNHHSMKFYTIVRIENDGVVVGYKRDSSEDGTVKLIWR